MKRLVSVLIASCLLGGILAQEPAAKQSNRVELAKRLKNSAVAVYATRTVTGGKEQIIRHRVTVSLSGFLCDKDGHILTVANAVEGASEISVEDESGNKSKAELVGVNDRDNVALLRVDIKNLSLSPIEFSEEVYDAGSEIVVVSSPLGLKNTVVFGMVSGKDRTLVGSGRIYSGMLQLATPPLQTDPGGLVADMNGKVVGMVAPAYLKPPVVAQTEELLQSIAKNLLELSEVFGNFIKDKTPEMRNKLEMIEKEAGRLLFPEKLLEPIMGASEITFAIPSSSLKKAVEALLRRKKTAWLGISVRPQTEPEGAQLPRGLIVVEVIENGPAHKAGVAPMDVLLSLDKCETKDIMTLKRLLEETLEPGKTVEMVIFRQGEKKRLQITPDSR